MNLFNKKLKALENLDSQNLLDSLCCFIYDLTVYDDILHKEVISHNIEFCRILKVIYHMLVSLNGLL